MWTARDQIAQHRDIAPGRILPDSAIIDAAISDPKTVDDLMALSPQAVVISPGPGIPEDSGITMDMVRAAIDLPLLGICLGHQLISLALGAGTYKLKFGHRGANQPVRNELTGRVEITSQNHGFAVEAKSLQQQGVAITHVNLNDDTVEGFVHKELPAFAVQYHPEASPGPHDARYLFDLFARMIETGRPPTDEEVAQAQGVA